jgi:hypothetical protein
MHVAVASPSSPELARPESLDISRRLLMLLLATDVAFILLHVIYVETSVLRGRPFSLELDNGVPEAYQYVKQFWLALCMGALFRRTRQVVYVGWAVVFAFLLMDDAFQIHEHVGKWLGEAHNLPTVFSLRPDDIGELLFAGAVGVVALALIGFGFWRGDSHARSASRDMGILTLLLAVLGVGVDIAHVIAYFNRSLTAQFLLIIEDGGEMIVLSGLAAYAFNVVSHRGRETVNLWSLMREQARRLKPGN